jgi:hypothetical protein
MTTLLFLANHLLLLDPAWNPAAEWQCFDRVHRLGQDKEVFIYKFITKVPESAVYFLIRSPRDRALVLKLFRHNYADSVSFPIQLLTYGTELRRSISVSRICLLLFPLYVLVKMKNCLLGW